MFVKRLLPLVLLTSLLGNMLLQTPACAAPDFKKGSIILDDELDEILTGWVRKIFSAARLKSYTPRVYLMVDPELNAAATVGGVILIHSGLILNCKDASQLLGVLAHEVGHIAGGHVSRIDSAFNEGLVPAAAAMLLGGAAAIATGDGLPLIAGLMGGAHIMERKLLRFSRTQESSADQAALMYLETLGWPSQGLHDFLKVIHDKTHMAVAHMDPYALTHPLTHERMSAVHHHVSSRSSKGQIPPEIEQEFQLLKAKISGFLETVKLVEQKWSKVPTPAGKYALAIAAYRQGQIPKAIDILNELSKHVANDGYIQELKGQILFENGKIDEAIVALDGAIKKQPKASLIKILLAQALIESKSPNAVPRAKQLLIPITQTQKDNAFAWRLLATAYGKENDLGMAAVCLAEEALLQEDFATAKTHAERAKKIFPEGSKGALQARDILHIITQKHK